jgi:folate-binding protein YgfZ
LLIPLSKQEFITEEFAIQEVGLFDSPCVLIVRSFCGDSGLLIFVPKASSSFIQKFDAHAAESEIIKISAKTFDTLRIEAGIPLFGIDMDHEQILPETGLEQYAASYSKGCFQGQEVLARIKTYGAPKRALVGLSLDSKFDSNAAINSILLNSEFKVNGEESGKIKSNCYSPTLNKYISMAYIARDYRVPGQKIKIEIDNETYNATVTFLPFYVAGSNKIKAKSLFEKALHEFARGSEEKAVSMLREVIELDPFLADAYESLGAILSRHEQYDEAIALMHRLQELDPNSIMAHTNLSIYYMHQGDKERAEEEKAISMSLRMSQLAKEHAIKKQEEEDKQKLAAEAEKRLEMFRQVLALDPHDFLANNGVGTVYVEIGRYEESIQYLQKAIAAKPTHTVAYLALGKAFEQLNRLDEAMNVYKKGIDLAAKRGDITPMKEMQVLLANVESRAASQ